MSYVDEQIAKYDNLMQNNTDYKVSTCDYRNWDRTLHRCFPIIAKGLRELGYSVSSSVNWGVTDWIIVNPNANQPKTQNR